MILAGVDAVGGMSSVEVVALWVGLIAGVAGIVLAVVSIWFANRVNERSQDVNDQTIQSLQKIESTVERLTESTTDLIRSAWDRMLGNLDGNVASSEDTTAVIIDGVAAELRSLVEGERGAADTGTGRATDIDVMAAEWYHNALDALGATRGVLDRTHDAKVKSPFEATVDLLAEASQGARELARQLSQGPHLTSSQYNKVRHPSRGPAAKALAELRELGLVIPLRPAAPEGEIPDPVYWLHPRYNQFVGAALAFVDHDPPADLIEDIHHALQSAEWPEPDEQS